MVIEKEHIVLRGATRAFTSTSSNVEVARFYRQKTNPTNLIVIELSSVGYDQQFSVSINAIYSLLDANGNKVEISNTLFNQNYSVPANTTQRVFVTVTDQFADAISVVVSFTRNASGGSGTVNVYCKEIS